MNVANVFEIESLSLIKFTIGVKIAAIPIPIIDEIRICLDHIDRAITATIANSTSAFLANKMISF